MEAFHNFIEVNMTMLYFVYGLVYFTTGLVIALQQRGLSNFRLAHHLWLLATFGIVHGLAEWGHVFIPIQNGYLSESWISFLYNLQELAWAASFGFLLQFGVIVIVPYLRVTPGVQNFVRWIAPSWSVGITLVGVLLLSEPAGENWIRYMLGFPAAVLAAAAFVAERRSFSSFSSRAARVNMAITALCFGSYAVLSGLTVPSNGVWPLAWLNYKNVFATTGLPIQFYRTLVGLAMAVFIIRMLSIFDLEIRHHLESIEKDKALLKDRQRIARDLHDGVIQSIYAAGMQLEIAGQEVGDKSEVGFAIQRVLDHLNNVISEMRGYIFQLGQIRNGTVGVESYIEQLVEEFTTVCGIAISFSVEGDRVELTPNQKQNVVMVLRECLGNVSRHSQASTVHLELKYRATGLMLTAEDDGIGIDNNRIEAASTSSGKGLRNMAERAEAMDAELTIAPGADHIGTTVSLWIPYGQDICGDIPGQAVVNR